MDSQGGTNANGGFSPIGPSEGTAIRWPGYFVQEGGRFSPIGPSEGTAIGFRVIFQIPKGAPGAYIKSLSQYPDEAEYLLPHSAKLKVIDGTEVNGKWTFVVEYQGVVSP